MVELARRLERITVGATSPDGRIRARVGGRLDLELAFAPRSYGRHTEAELGHQLGQLATLAWTRYHREYLEVESAFLDHAVQEQDARDRLFEERAKQLTVERTSPARWVTVRSRALARWDFHLDSGVLQRLSERHFINEVLGATADTIRAYRAGRARLLDEFYSLADGLPPWRRERAAAPPGRTQRAGDPTGSTSRTDRA
jgi:hypothetical protein